VLFLTSSQISGGIKTNLRLVLQVTCFKLSDVDDHATDRALQPPHNTWCHHRVTSPPRSKGKKSEHPEFTVLYVKR